MSGLHIDYDAVFFIGVAVGLLIALTVAGWVIIDRTRGNERPMTPEDIRRRVGEQWGDK